MEIPNLQIEKRAGVWWIVGLEIYPGDHYGMGPYNAKSEAESDRRGVRRFYRETQDAEMMRGPMRT